MKYYGAIEAGGTKFVCSVIADIRKNTFPSISPVSI